MSSTNDKSAKLTAAPEYVPTAECDAIRGLLDYYVRVHEEGDNSMWSLSIHCLAKFYKYRGLSFEDLIFRLRGFHPMVVNPESQEADLETVAEWLRSVWDSAPEQMPCLDLRHLLDENGDPFCKCGCIQARGKMYDFARKEPTESKLVKLKSREKRLSQFVRISDRGSGKYLVNAEPGVGKTVGILKELARTEQKVLYLAPRHELLEQIKKKYLENGGKSKDIYVYKGIKQSSCPNSVHVAGLMERGVPYRRFCIRYCSHLNSGKGEHKNWDNCVYRNQRTEAAGRRILLMATPVLVNQNLIHTDEFDNRNRSIIVVDEDHLQHTSTEIQIKKEDLISNIRFIKIIMEERYWDSNTKETLQPLLETANRLFNFLNDKNKPALLLSFDCNKEAADRINLDRLGKHIYESARKHRRFINFLYDLKYLYSEGGIVYRRTIIHGLSVLCFYRRMTYPENKTYYFLDGAPDVSLYEQLFPDIKVLKRESNALELFKGAKIIQYIENSFSSSSLTRASNSKMAELKEIITAILSSKLYDRLKVGIIAKQAVEEDLKEFIKNTFPGRKPEPVIKHFGDITGVDDFKEYPVGIVVGMHSLYFTDYAREAERLFGEYTTAEHRYRWTEIFSNEEYTYKVINPFFTDPKVYSMFKQFCIGAAIQAIGRWRPYRSHGRTFCHIFLLNNYSTGLPVSPMQKNELFEFLNATSKSKPNDADRIRKAAWNIMRKNGRVKNEDIRDELSFSKDRKSKVSKVLSPMAKRMGWRQDEDYYYYEQ